MIPISSDADFAIEEIRRLKLIGRPAVIREPGALNILILGDGFAPSDKELFDVFVREMVHKALAISPFQSLGDYINWFACFTPSKESKVEVVTDVAELSPDAWRTVYGGYVLKSLPTGPSARTIYEMEFRDSVWDRLWALLGNISFPDGFLDVASFTTPLRMWARPAANTFSKSFGAICVVCNTADITELKDVTIIGGEQRQRDTETSSLAYFAISMQGYTAEGNQLQGGYQHSMVHELGHVLRLSDEYELGGDQWSEASSDKQPGGLNVLFSESTSVDRVAAAIEGSQYWKAVLTTEEVEGIKSGTRVFTRERLIAARPKACTGADNILLSVTDVDNRIYRNHPTTNALIDRDEVYAVEGAVYRRRMFRLAFDCRMRYSKYDERIMGGYDCYKVPLHSGNYAYGAPDFCRVCKFVIRELTVGFRDFGIAGLPRNRLETIFYDIAMPRVNRSFQGTGMSTSSQFCHIASARAAIVLRQYGVRTIFALNEGHVWLECDGLPVDPTFFDFYTVSGSAAMNYRTAENVVMPFEPGRTNLGLIGTIGEFENYFYNRIPLDGSLAQSKNPSWILPAWTQEMTEFLYREPVRWDGESATVQPDSVAIGAYARGIQGEFQKWRAYRAGGSAEQGIQFLDRGLAILGS
jgi:hypothetical protein